VSRVTPNLSATYHWEHSSTSTNRLISARCPAPTTHFSSARAVQSDASPKYERPLAAAFAL